MRKLMLQNVVTEYVTERLVEQVGQEIADFRFQVPCVPEWDEAREVSRLV